MCQWQDFHKKIKLPLVSGLANVLVNKNIQFVPKAFFLTVYIHSGAGWLLKFYPPLNLAGRHPIHCLELELQPASDQPNREFPVRDERPLGKIFLHILI